jgi:serpin B
MRKIILSTLVTAILALTACSTDAPAPGEGRAPGEAVASSLERVSAPEVSGEAVDELVEGNTAFALDLYSRLVEEQGDENLFYSPYSISLALAMTYAGARGETEEQMADALHYTLPQDQLHPAFNALDQTLESRGEGAEGQDDEGFRLNIANAIWGQKDYAFRDAFLDVLAVNYGAGLRLLDFAGAPERARNTINEWVSEKTEGKIEELIPRGLIGPMTRLVLTNAIYFNAAWAEPFEEEATRDGAFHPLTGSEVTVPMMRQTTSFGYTEGEGYQAVELPYDGRELSMVVLVPDEGAFHTFEGALDAERLSAIVDGLTNEQVTLTMPRFEYRSGFSVNDALKALGMTDAFSGSADFSGMTGSRDLFISSVIHKAFVSVDEEGTEAAAATAVAMVESAMPGEPVELTVDRPFIFTIRDIETGAVLFVGRVVDPS